MPASPREGRKTRSSTRSTSEVLSKCNKRRPSSLQLMDSDDEKENIPPPADTDTEDGDEEASGSSRRLRSRKRPAHAEATKISKRAKPGVRVESSVSPPPTPVASSSPLEPDQLILETPTKTAVTKVKSLLSPPATPIKSIPSASIYTQARAVLRCSDVSSSASASSSARLVGRAAERDAILNFTSDANPSRALYVAGQPGTGKTALITQVASELEEAGWVTGYTNCVGAGKAIWKLIGEALGFGGVRGMNDIETFLKENEETKHLLVLDELDALLSIAPIAASTAKSTSLHLLETLFSLPSTNPNLYIISIANSLDFTSRHLSRLSQLPSVLQFSAYGMEDLSAIVRGRLRGLLPQNSPDVEAMSTPVFDDKAIELAARKVQAENGDLRMCLDVCRIAVELCETEVRKIHAKQAGAECQLVHKYISSLTAVDAPKAKMQHVLKAVSVTKSTPAASARPKPMTSAFSSTAGLSTPPSTPQKSKISGVTVSKIQSLNLQSRLVLVAIIIHSSRALNALRPLGSSINTIAVSPSAKTPLVTNIVLYSTYTYLLSGSNNNGIIQPVSSLDFQSILSNLSDSSLVRMASAKSSPSSKNKIKAAAERKVELGCMEEEVVNGLTGGAGIAEEELRRIYTREMDRIERAKDIRERDQKRAAETCPDDERL